jgi:hypothetical protein
MSLGILSSPSTAKKGSKSKILDLGGSPATAMKKYDIHTIKDIL